MMILFPFLVINEPLKVVHDRSGKKLREILFELLDLHIFNFLKYFLNIYNVPSV